MDEHKCKICGKIDIETIRGICHFCGVDGAADLAVENERLQRKTSEQPCGDGANHYGYENATPNEVVAELLAEKDAEIARLQKLLEEAQAEKKEGE